MAAIIAEGNDTPAIFLTLGHGDDNVDVPFESRVQLPPGFTLVTLAECGAVTMVDSVYPMMDAFCNPDMKAILQDPLTNISAVTTLVDGNRINIYRPGDMIPDLGLHLFLEWIENPELGAKAKRKMYVQQSGVYKFPVTEGFDLGGTNVKDKYVSATWSALDNSVKLNKKDEILQMYRNSLFPTQAEMGGILDATGMDFKKVKKETYHKLSSVFHRLGPGVYYFVVCRSIYNNNYTSGNVTREIMSYNKNTVDGTSGVTMPANENYNNFKRIRNAYNESSNQIQFYPTIFPYIIRGVEGYRKGYNAVHSPLNPGWDSEYMNEPRFIKRRFRNVTRTRRLSFNQQQKYSAAAEGGGGGGEAVGGAGAAEPPLALVENFKPLNKDSSLEEVLSELPHLNMKGVNDEIMLREYEAMMGRYPQFRESIKNDMYRIIMNCLKINRLKIPREEKVALIDARLASIQRVFGPHRDYSDLVDAAGKYVEREKPRMNGGARRTRRARK
jgi:hypothetical protein